MNNNICSSLNYDGKVSFSYCLNGKKFKIEDHNSGFPELFRILTKALAGYSIQEELPFKIDLVVYTTSTEYHSVLYNQPRVTAVRYYQENSSDPYSWSTFYTAAILPSDLIDDDNSSEFKLILKSKEGIDIAEVSVDYEAIKMLRNGAEIIIDWRLYFSNTKIIEEV